VEKREAKAWFVVRDFRRRVWLASCAWKGLSAITFAAILKPEILFFLLPLCVDLKMLYSGARQWLCGGRWLGEEVFSGLMFIICSPWIPVAV
jgi:hypothetical protein